MILLVGLVLGLALALVLGGRPSRLMQLTFRTGWAVALSLAIQIVLFSRLGSSVTGGLARALHLSTYALLVLFLWQNRRLRILLPLGLGMLLNAVVISVNDGRMPLSRAAARAAGQVPGDHANVAFAAHRLAFLGDVVPLPHRLPLAVAISPGDVLIVLGTILLVTVVSLGGAGGATAVSTTTPVADAPAA